MSARCGPAGGAQIKHASARAYLEGSIVLVLWDRLRVIR